MGLETKRAVLIKYRVDGQAFVGSGLRVRERFVLTADHCAGGEDHQVVFLQQIRDGRVVADGDTYPAAVHVRSGSAEVDLAVLLLGDDAPPMPGLGPAQVGRDVAEPVGSCQALGFPRWKRDPNGERVLVQIDGSVPTGEGRRNSGLELLELKGIGDGVRANPTATGELDQTSPWGGMSGAVVVTNDLVLGVIRSHNLAAGTMSLTVTPLDALFQLPPDLARVFVKALELPEVKDWPVLPDPRFHARRGTDNDVHGNEMAAGLLRSARVASGHARTAVRPETLPNVDRLGQMESGLGPMDSITFPLVITGEGGLGKSVLAGQLYERFTATEAAIGVVLFVPCARIPASAGLGSAAEVDMALGQALADTRDATPLTRVLARVSDGARAIVIIDTLDLILREENADDISFILGVIAGSARMILTCREQEWHDLLETDPGSVKSIYRLPKLSRTEIQAWASNYVEASKLPAAQGRVFIISLTAAVSKKGISEVFSSPLRLAMACAIYATDGAIPEDLTVTQLYKEYWARRVEADRRGRRGTEASKQSAAAEGLADEVWRASRSRFVEYVVPDHEVSRAHLSKLLSEGIVKRIGAQYAFFHQSFAEFAVSRHLAHFGTAEDLERLKLGLAAGTPGYWAIANHIVMLEMSEPRYDEVSACIPRTSVEGVRTNYRGAFARLSAARVEELSADVWLQNRDLLLTSLDVLELAPETCIPAVVLTGILALENADQAHLSRAGSIVASLIQRSAADARTPALQRSVATLTSRTEALGKELTSSVTRRLLAQTVGIAPAGYDRKTITEMYGDLPGPARAEVIGAIRRLRHRPTLDRSFLSQALGHECPEGAVDDATALLVRSWGDAPFRAQRGWRDWLSMVNSDLPERWDACQVRLLLHLCQDPATARELLNVTFGAGPLAHRDRCTNSIMYLGDDQLRLVVEAMRAVTGERSGGPIGSLSSVAIHIAPRMDQETRRAVTTVMQGYLPVDPRRVWPALIKLSASDVEMLRERTEELSAFAEGQWAGHGDTRAIVRSALDTLLKGLDQGMVRQLENELRELCMGEDPRDRQRRARLEGLLTPRSAVARDWVWDQFRVTGGDRITSEAAQGVVDAMFDWSDYSLAGGGLSWLYGLLSSRYSNAVRTVATGLVVLGDRVALPAGAPGVVERMHQAMEDQSDPQLLEALLRLLSASHRSGEVTVAQVRTVVYMYWVAVRDGLSDIEGFMRITYLPAAFAQFMSAISTLALGTLEAEEVERIVVGVLTGMDCGAIAGRSRHSLASMLTGAVHRYPLLMPRIEAAWISASDANKYAMAECFLRIDAESGGMRALGFARRADCPSLVASYIHSHIAD